MSQLPASGSCTLKSVSNFNMFKKCSTQNVALDSCLMYVLKKIAIKPDRLIYEFRFDELLSVVLDLIQF